ncbi:6901_t:CDS:2 [Ambispora gerdemannii]|uniref:6901_t:CDS:1 n=1 Tax=Ambispora gerdemannii TaxID=144530 RepID=A0A9N9D349_9GLOM|nr:6901_t:CDS:2 [Ambispora gerdemannii]
MGDIERDNNWPKFRPIIFHDIEVDIDESVQRKLAKRSYNLWKFQYITLVANLLAVCAMAVANIGGKIGIIIAIVFLVFYPMFDFVGRHLRLYHGLRNDNVTSLRLFFLAQSIDILFEIFIIIGVFLGGGGGLIGMSECFKKSKYCAGTLSAICVFLVSILLAYKIKLSYDVKRFMNNRGWNVLPGGGAKNG